MRVDARIAADARAVSSRAIKEGRLHPCHCEVCDAGPRVCGHHEDYSKPLDVRWLCHRCHIRLHQGKFALISDIRQTHAVDMDAYWKAGKHRKPAPFRPKRWHSVARVAEKLRCCQRTVRTLIRQGVIPARIWLGTRIRVLESDLEAYMNEAPKFKPRKDTPS